MLAWAWLLLGAVGNALAQPAAALPSMHYEAAAGCPTQSAFAERMRARLLADGTRVPAEISLRVVLSARGAGTHGSVEVQRGATKTQRTVEGGGCDEVADALALIAALALSEQDARATHHDSEKRAGVRKVDKAGALRRPTAQQGSDRDRRSARDARIARGTTDRADKGASSADEASSAADSGGNAAESGAQVQAARAQRGENPARSDASAGQDTAAAAHSGVNAGPAASRIAQPSAAAAPSGTSSGHVDAARLSGAATRSGGSAAGAITADKAPASSERNAKPRGSGGAWRLGGSVGAAAMLFSGLAPSLQPGLQLMAALSLGSDSSTWSAQLGARIAHSERMTSPNGDARFGFAGAVVRLCASSPLGSQRLVLSGCAVAEPGVFSISGENTTNRRSHSRFWLAAGAAAELSVGLASWLNVRGGAELSAPFRRDRVLLAGDTLYRVPALGLRLHLGLEVPFR